MKARAQAAIDALARYRCGGRYGIASACIGGGQGIALLIENAEAAMPATRAN